VTASFLIRDKNPSKTLRKELKMVSDPHLFWVLRSYIGISEQFCKVGSSHKSSKSFWRAVLGWSIERVSWGLCAGQEGAPCERAHLPLIAFDLLMSRLLAAKAHRRACRLCKPLGEKVS